MRPFLAGMAAIALLATATAFPVRNAHATTVSIVAGRSMTSGARWTTTAFGNIAFDRTFTWQDLQFQPVATLGWIKGRHTRVDNLNHNVYVGGAGLRLVNWWDGAFFSFQLGAAGGRTNALSSGVEFISSLGWAGHHLIVMLRHISNGDLFGGENLGETMLLAGVRF